MIWKEFARIKFAGLRECSGFLESYLKEESDRLKMDAKKRAFGMTASAQQDYYECVSDDFYQFEKTFPQILRHSLFTQSYSLFEYLLYCYADGLGHSMKRKLSPKDLNGKGIEQTRNYLIKVVGLSWPEMEVWQDIAAMRKVRNQIAHQTGFYQHTDQHLEALIKKWNPDLFTDNHQLQLSANFIRRAIDTFEQFFNELTERAVKPPVIG